MFDYDENGNLQATYTVTFQELNKKFGGDATRIALLTNAFIFFKIFRSFGCMHVYIVGSFSSLKKKPNDIDLCVDITNLNYKALKEKYPEFFTEAGINAIKKDHKCHIVGFFDSYTFEILDWFRTDRNGNRRGLIKVVLNDILLYDKK